MSNSETDNAENGKNAPGRKFCIPGNLLIFLAMIVILGYFTLPDLSAPPGYRSRRASAGNLHMICLALDHYHDTYGTFPPAYIADKEGRPMHSWRVLILNGLAESELYEAYDFDKPWDDPENLKLVERIPEDYVSPHFGEHRSEGLTTYLAISAEGTVLGTTEGSRLEDIAEPTVMVIEAKGNPVPWTKPEDTSPAQVKIDPERILSRSIEGTHLLMSDGSVRFVENKPPRKDVRRGFYVDGGSKIDEDR